MTNEVEIKLLYHFNIIMFFQNPSRTLFLKLAQQRVISNVYINFFEAK